MSTRAPREQRLAVFPEAPMRALDTLWFQVAGTLCNLTCTHCFISCSPHNHTHAMMSLEQVEEYLREAERLGVREYYFTGGEPFMNREILAMTRAALARGPTTILTNGLLLKLEVTRALKGLSDASEYSLDLRISLDGFDARTNDAIRGAGTFDRILEGIRCAAVAGLNPVLTVTEACPGAGSQDGRLRFFELLRDLGLPKPRLKVMALLRIGAEAGRGRAYAAWETLANETLTEAELEALQCSTARMITASGVWVCPILLDEPSARLGATLEESLRPFPLARSACYTCHVDGLSCRT